MTEETIHLAQNNKRVVESLKRDVLALTICGERQVGSTGHRVARDYLIARMSELGISPYKGNSFELPYDDPAEDFVNLAARIPGRSKGRKPVLVGAHYDTCGPYPGADDNASALAIALAAAEKLKSKVLELDVILVFFDAEEPPYFMTRMMGSINFYASQMWEKIDCAIIMDLL